MVEDHEEKNINPDYARSEVLTAVLLMNEVFWDVILCCSEGGARQFERSQFIHLEGLGSPGLRCS
jgi:hypothetical protein